MMARLLNLQKKQAIKMPWVDKIEKTVEKPGGLHNHSKRDMVGGIGQ
jgi:hypothetical protein